MKNLSTIIAPNVFSTSQAKRLIMAGAVKVNGDQVLIDQLIDETVSTVIEVGNKNKFTITILGK